MLVLEARGGGRRACKTAVAAFTGMAAAFGGADARAGEREEAAWAAFKESCLGEDRHYGGSLAAFEAAGFDEPYDDARVSRELSAIAGAVDGRAAEAASRCFVYLPGGDRAAMELLLERDFDDGSAPLLIQAASDSFVAYVIGGGADAAEEPMSGVLVGLNAPIDPQGAPGFVALTWAGAAEADRAD